MNPTHYQSGYNEPGPSNPYWQPAASSYYYNSHYLQAYSQSAPVPQSNNNVQTAHTSSRTPVSYGSMSTWYQSGNNRCTQQGCSFTGSQKTVELHMMDRHLVYPPGWEKRKKKSDWDADPSLKGKPIPIQGTTVILDTPEAMDAWIAERKKRFPTKEKVEEKKRKMEEAIARGQLDLTNHGGGSNKRRKLDNAPNDRFRGSKQGQGAALPITQTRKFHPLPPKPPARLPEPAPLLPDSESDDDDGEPEALSSKIPSNDVNEAEELKVPDPVPVVVSPPRQTPSSKASRNRVVQPKAPPRNPFASRPTLLRNLLLPEIRVTISNLSQAIRFLVDNDFLQDVELKPGEAAERDKIQVIHHDESNEEGRF